MCFSYHFQKRNHADHVHLGKVIRVLTCDGPPGYDWLEGGEWTALFGHITIVVQGASDAGLISLGKRAERPFARRRLFMKVD